MNDKNESVSVRTDAVPEAAEPAAAEQIDAAPRKPAKTFDPHAMLTVSTSPHIKSPVTTRSLMIDVLIALMPALIWGIFVFGFRALTVVCISVLSSIGFEALYEKLMKKPVTVLDFSAAVTGVLIGFSMPVTVPLWLPVVGSFFAIVIVKQLYGGLGRNFMNPALAARAFLMLAWPADMAASPIPFIRPSAIAFTIPSADIVASASPLQLLKQGAVPEGGLFNLLIGCKSGCIGEISALLLIAGGVYLLVRRVITWHIPAAYLGVVALCCYIFPQTSYRNEFTALELICGSIMLGAFFMATDYVTSPVTAKGRLLFGAGCGLITVFIRFFGTYPEGVTFAILIMNTLVWYIDRFTKPTKFGGQKK